MIYLNYECCGQEGCKQNWQCIEGDHPEPETCPECGQPGRLVSSLDTEDEASHER